MQSSHPEIPKALRRAALLVAAPLLFAACGDSPPPPDDIQLHLAEETAVDTVGEMIHAMIELSAVNESGVQGEAIAMHTDDTVIVLIEVSGLPEEGEYAAHIHTGSCESGGPVAIALNPVLGEADGTGTSTTTFDADDLPTDAPQFIQVHGAGGTPIACGDIEGHGDHDPAT